MIWILKQRSLVNKLYKFIWKEKHPIWINKNNGVSQGEFIDWLWQKGLREEYEDRFKRFWITVIVKRVDKNYVSDFMARNEKLVKDCIKDGYIDKDNDGLLTVSSRGKRFLSATNNIWNLLNSQFFLTFIKWVAPPTILGYFFKDILKDYLLK